MAELQRDVIEKIISSLDRDGWLFQEFGLSKTDDGLVLLGSGGFSTVYEMYDISRPEYKYALKVIGFDRHFVTSKQFLDSVSIQYQLGNISKNVVKVIDARELLLKAEKDGSITGIRDAEKTERWSEAEDSLHLQFIIMEKLQDILHKDKYGHVYLNRKELQNEKEVFRLAEDIGEALFQSHYNNVLHRDIKLENIFWDEKDNCYKLGDFGIAKQTENGNAETVLYTDGYGAPEIERRLSDHYGATADIYSLGISLYLLLNELKFPCSDGYYVNMVQYDPEFVIPAPCNASELTSELIRIMCSYEKDERYQSVEEFVQDLRFVEHGGNSDHNDENITTDEVTEKDTEDADQDTVLYEEDNLKAEGDIEKGNCESNADDFRAAAEETTVLTRSERKRREKIYEQDYIEANVFYFICFSLLIMESIFGLKQDPKILNDGMFWMMIPAAFIEFLLQKIKDVDVAFGVLIIAFGIYCVFRSGLSYPVLLMIIFTAVGIPVLLASALMAIVVWSIISLTGKLTWLDVTSKSNIGWMFITIILILLYFLFETRITYEKVSEIRTRISVYYYDKGLLVIFAIGIVILLLQHFGVVEFPALIIKMHIERVGIISYVACQAMDRYNGYR